MQRLNLKGTVMLGDEECFHFTIVNDVCTEFTPASNHVTRYPFGCDPSKFPNYKENTVLFFYDRSTPPTRQGLHQELQEIGMKYYDMGKLIEYQNGRSVSDPFWVKFNNER